ncbi:MAG: hypothetical protein MUQ27_03110, partial [Acidimicrobiia bacterium]|nr:hypothetical protein [Acidimicrobiia bacterium]
MRRAWSRVWPVLPVAAFAVIGWARVSTSRSIETGAIRRTMMDLDLVAAGLRELGISEGTYVRFHIGRTLFVSSLLLALAFTVALKARDRGPAGLFAFAFSGFGYLLFTDVFGLDPGPGPVGLAVGSLLYWLFFISFYVFPDGKFVPRWTRWLGAMWLVAPLSSLFP